MGQRVHELAGLAAVDLVAAYRTGRLSPLEVTRAVLDVVSAREPVLRAMWDVAEQSALAAARRSEDRWRRGEPQGPIDGVPVTVKENLARTGVPMPAGCAGVQAVVPQRDSPLVARILESGGVIIGSTVMPDWGMLSSGVSSLHGVTRSPWDPSRTTGGSSSGAGAAAVAGYGPLHVGTDIGGSIRLPGTWLGLTTLKPSAGRVPLDAPYLGRVAGPMARSALDAALLLSVISRPDVRDWTSLPPEDLSAPLADLRLDVGGLRIGLLPDAGAGLPLDDEIGCAVQAAASVFAEAGAKVDLIEPFVTDAMLDGLDEFWRVRSLVDLLALPEERRERVLPFIRRWVGRAAEVTGITLMQDYTSIMALQAATAAATEPYDLVLSPVAPMSAFPAEWPMPWGPDADLGMAHIAYTAPYNMTGQPAATTNCGFTRDGRTIGLQIAGRRFDDVGALRAAQWFEEHGGAGLRPRWPCPEVCGE